ncbi:MAG: EAL domain-containing protein [Eubacteriales bacterium]|nr:EAL domain-containing protein [Eubacteriales bacterium]
MTEKEYTPQSFLSRLKVLPIDRVKMDMQFVHGIEESEKDQAIAKAIINLVKNMNLNIIAEGVETKCQYDFLSKRMCNEIQGYIATSRCLQRKSKKP